MAVLGLSDTAQLLPVLFGGGLIGSLLTLMIQHRLAQSSRRSEMRLDAYTSYLMAVARASFPGGKEEFIASRRDLVFAKMRVLAVGSGEVVRALRALEERNHELLSQGFEERYGKDDAWSAALVQVVSKIRKDLAPKGNVEVDTIHSIILNPRQPIS